VLNRLRRRLARRSAAAAVARGLPRGTRKADVKELLRLARLSFLQMQEAWDRADLQAMGSLTTAPLREDLRRQLAHRGPGPNHTEAHRGSSAQRVTSTEGQVSKINPAQRDQTAVPVACF